MMTEIPEDVHDRCNLAEVQHPSGSAPAASCQSRCCAREGGTNPVKLPVRSGLLVVAMVTTLAAGCGDSDNRVGPSPTTSASPGVTTTVTPTPTTSPEQACLDAGGLWDDCGPPHVGCFCLGICPPVCVSECLCGGFFTCPQGKQCNVADCGENIFGICQ